MIRESGSCVRKTRFRSPRNRNRLFPVCSREPVSVMIVSILQSRCHGRCRDPSENSMSCRASRDM